MSTEDPMQSSKMEKKFYQQWWFWVAAGILFVAVLVVSGEDQSKMHNTSPSPTVDTAGQPVEKESDIPAEYKSALSKATSYANDQYMSKQGVYDQLTSEYGERFTAEAAQYAIDNVKANWNTNALAKAKSYQSQQSMSPAAIRDQLVSSYGEKFTETEADYAIQHLND